MRKTLLVIALAACACATQPSLDAPNSLAAAETAFASHSVREDMRVAFLAAFADDGVFVRKGWTVSNDYLRSQPAPKIVLDWRPQYVEVAGSGELGLSTGPWKITSKTDPKADPAFGQFVSIWRRQPAGPWKVEVDIGIAHPREALWKAPLEARNVRAVSAGASGGIAEAEARFARDSLGRGARAAYEGQGASDLRYYRSGQEPVASRAAALASPAMTDARYMWTLERMETARSGDFGYARGRYAAADAPDKALGYFMRVWRREADAWRIVLDVANPAT